MLQARKEKDVIRQNRIAREEQYADARAKEFQEALERESVCYQFHTLKKIYTLYVYKIGNGEISEIRV